MRFVDCNSILLKPCKRALVGLKNNRRSRILGGINLGGERAAFAVGDLQPYAVSRGGGNVTVRIPKSASVHNDDAVLN